MNPRINRLTRVALLLGISLCLGAQQLTLGTVSAPPGQTVSLSVQLATGGAQIAGVQFDLIYDPNTFTVTPTAGAAATAAGKGVQTNMVQSNDMRLIVTGINQTAIASGDIADLSIQIASKATAASYSLAVSGVIGTAPGATVVSVAATNGTVNVAASLQFYPLTPCRVADTRNGFGYTGTQGPPSLAGGTSRDFQVAGLCGVPYTAAAYSVNVTVVPTGGVLNFLTTWPTGQPRPEASTLNSPEGVVLANAAMVPAGTNGDISIYASDATNVLFDINGYFAPPAASGLQFYPLTPCRVADTRGNGYTGTQGQPSMAGGTSRNFQVAGLCGVPANASAYSINVTVVPKGGVLNFLTTWPTGQPRPDASTLNSPEGAVLANAAMVPAGTSGNIGIYVSDSTDVLFDINGYFAPPAASGLQFYPLTPCRVADTRNGFGYTGTQGPPYLAGGTSRNFQVAGLCGVPSTAAAYSINVTVVPTGGVLNFLTTWPTGQPRPNASTLNSPEGVVLANAAMVPAGTSGDIGIYVSDSTNVLFDINGFFAPGQ